MTAGRRIRVCLIPVRLLAMLTGRISATAPAGRTVGPRRRADATGRTAMRRLLILRCRSCCCSRGCDMVVLSPVGLHRRAAARPAGHLDAADALIIIPVMVLTVFFAWRYSAKRERALRSRLAPLHQPRAGDLGGAAADHHLPRRDHLGRHPPARPVPPARRASASAGRCRRTSTPLEVQVVALDWKWLFIYPQYGIATVNDAAAPVDRPIRFHLTSAVGDERLLRAGAGRA